MPPGPLVLLGLAADLDLRTLSPPGVRSRWEYVVAEVAAGRRLVAGTAG